MKTRPPHPAFTPHHSRYSNWPQRNSMPPRRCILVASIAGLLAGGFSSVSMAAVTFFVNSNGQELSGSSPVSAGSASAGVNILFSSDGEAGYINDSFSLDPIGAGQIGELTYSFVGSASASAYGGDIADDAGGNGQATFSVQLGEGRNAYGGYLAQASSPGGNSYDILGTPPFSGTLGVFSGDLVSLGVAGGGGGTPPIYSEGGGSGSGNATLNYTLTIWEDRRHWAPSAGGTIIGDDAAQWKEEHVPNSTAWAVFNDVSRASTPTSAPLPIVLDSVQTWRGLIVDGEKVDFNLGGLFLNLGSAGPSRKVRNIIVGEGRATNSQLTLRNGFVTAALGIMVDGQHGAATELALDNADVFLQFQDAYVGATGAGQLSLRGISSLNGAGVLYLGGGPGASGGLLVDGANASVGAAALVLGQTGGTGNVEIKHGGDVRLVSVLGDHTPAFANPRPANRIDVAGVGSTLTVTSFAKLGGSNISQSGGYSVVTDVTSGAKLITDGATVAMKNQSAIHIGGAGSELRGGDYTLSDGSFIVAGGGGKLSKGSAGPFQIVAQEGSDLILENHSFMEADALALQGGRATLHDSTISLDFLSLWSGGHLEMVGCIGSLDWVWMLGGQATLSNTYIAGPPAGGTISTLSIDSGKFTMNQTSGARFGKVYVGGGPDPGHLTLDGAGTLLAGIATMDIEGRVTVSNGATLSGTQISIFDGGQLDGNGGTINGNVVNFGTVSPGNTPGVLTINGDYTQEAGGQLVMEIGGVTGDTEYDQLIVTGNMTLGGTVVLSFINGFAPQIGQTFNLLDLDGTLGNAPAFRFVGLKPGWTYSTNYNAATGTYSMTSLSNGIAAEPPEFRILSFSPTGPDKHTLTWSSVIGATYRLESSTDLAPETWTDSGGDILATQEFTSAQVTRIAGEAKRFWRVKRLP